MGNITAVTVIQPGQPAAVTVNTGVQGPAGPAGATGPTGPSGQLNFAFTQGALSIIPAAATIGANLLLSSAASQPILVQSFTYTGSGSSFSASFSNPTTAGNLLVVFVSSNEANSVPAGYTQQAAITNSGAISYVGTKTCVGSADQTMLITTYGSGDTQVTGFEYRNFGTVSGNSGYASGSTLTAAGLSTYANSLVLTQFVTTSSTTTLSSPAPSGSSLLFNQGDGYGWKFAVVSTPGTSGVETVSVASSASPPYAAYTQIQIQTNPTTNTATLSAPASATSGTAGELITTNGNGLLDPSMITPVAGALSASSTIPATQLGGVFRQTASGITTTFPTPVGNTGASITVWNNSTGSTTVSTPSGSFTGPAAYGLGTYYSTLTLPSQTGLEFVSDGTNWEAYLLSSPAGSATFLSSGTGAIPPWARQFRIRGVGGGSSGAGGGPIPPSGSGSGGAGGGTGFKLDTGWLPVSSLSTLSYSVAIGAGGAASAAGAAGNIGGNSTATFGSTVFYFQGATSTAPTAGASGQSSTGGRSGGSWGVSAATVGGSYNGTSQGGYGSSSTGVSSNGANVVNGPSSGAAGGGLNAGVFQAGASSGYSLASNASSNAAGGSIAGAAGANGSNSTSWPNGVDGCGGGGGAGNASGAGGAGGYGGQPGGGGGGGGSCLTSVSTTQSGSVTGGNTLTVSSATGITNGMYIFDLTTPSAVPYGITVTISGTTVTTSGTVASASGNTLLFGNYLGGTGGAGGAGAAFVEWI